MQIEKQKWTQIAEGDQQAYAEVYRFYYRRFYNYGMKFTRNEDLIEDSVQETLLTIWDKRHTLASIQFPGTYFYTAFRHILLGKLKQQQRLASDEFAHDEPAFAADQIMIARETEAATKDQLEKALATLTARQREAVFLRFYEGLSYEEVASVLNITTKATYKVMARALAQLKESLILPVFFYSFCSSIGLLNPF